MPPTRNAVIAHVIPQDIPRGAQRYASFMTRSINDMNSHEIVTIFDSTTSELQADHELKIPSGSLRRWGLDLRAVMALRSRLKEMTPDVVVAHGGEAMKYLALSFPRSVASIYVRIGISTVKANLLPRRLFQYLLLRVPTHIVAVSEAVRDELIDRYRIPRARVTVIPNSRSESVFRPRQSWDSNQTPTVMFVGHLIESKRPELFVDVMASLRRRGIPFDAQIAGSGPLFSEVADLASAAQVEMLGRRSDVPDLLREADLLVFTSLREGEGMPGVLIEAALSGLPIVSTDVPGAEDVIDNGVSGFLVPVNDRRQIEERVQSLLLDPMLRAKMGEAARLRAQERFTMSATSRMWSDLFDRYLYS